MREDALDTSTKLGNDGGHAFTSFRKGRTMDVCFRGNTAYIEAGTAHIVALENHHLQALLGSIFGSAISTRARTNDNEISCCH